MSGRYRSPTYYSWSAALDRCRRKTHVAWSRYGGRGIRVCERWRAFENFLKDMGERPIGRCLERIDNDGNYESGNCRWATFAEQARNRAPPVRLGPPRNAIWIEARGERLPVATWEARSGISRVTICGRLTRGWSPERAIFTPPALRHVRLTDPRRSVGICRQEGCHD